MLITKTRSPVQINQVLLVIILFSCQKLKQKIIVNTAFWCGRNEPIIVSLFETNRSTYFNEYASDLLKKQKINTAPTYSNERADQK